MNRLLFVTLMSTVCAFAQNQVPTQYQAIYDLINTQLTTFDTSLRAGWNGQPYPYMTSPQLESVSSDLFTNLLATGYYDRNVTPELNSLQALGAQGVTIHIDVPILYLPFYASNPAQYQQFVQFYQQVALDVHARGMKLIVETGVGSVMPGDLVNQFLAFYSSLNWTEYMTARAVTCLNIAQLVQPDYLSAITEPDSEVNNSGQPNAGTVSGSTQLLTTILATLKAGNVKNVAVGAGTGSWQKDNTQFVQSFLLQPIQYLDIHIYPVNLSLLPNAAVAAQMAHAAHKEVAMSECWDWKISDAELGVLHYQTIETRNPFSFWAPDDQQFLQTMGDFAQADQLTFVSPFWSRYFSAYLSWAQDGSLSPTALMSASFDASKAAVDAGQYTSTGHAVESLVLPAPDTTAPSVPATPTLSSAGSTSVEIAWVPATDNVGVAGYHLFRNGAKVTDVNASSYYDTALTSGASYNYSLEAFDASGNVSSPSQPLTVETIDITPPSAPTNLKVTGHSTTYVSLSWNPSQGIDGVKGYKVLKGTSPTSLVVHAYGITGTTYTDTQTGPNKLYYYEVEGYVDNGINGPPSNEVSVTTN